MSSCYYVRFILSLYSCIQQIKLKESYKFFKVSNQTHFVFEGGIVLITNKDEDV